MPIILTVVLAILIAPLTAVSGTPQSATKVVEALHASLLEIMKDSESLGYQGRFDRLQPIVASSFDHRRMAARSVGRTPWKQLSEPEQELWVESFMRFTLANYAGRFKGYSGEQFQTLDSETTSNSTIVRTKILIPSDDDVELDYKLRETDQGEWQIIDVYFNGTVSEIALKRAEYSDILKRESFTKLVEVVDEKIAELAKNGGKSLAASPR